MNGPNKVEFSITLSRKAYQVINILAYSSYVEIEVLWMCLLEYRQAIKIDFAA